MSAVRITISVHDRPFWLTAIERKRLSMDERKKTEAWFEPDEKQYQRLCDLQNLINSRGWSEINIDESDHRLMRESK